MGSPERHLGDYCMLLNGLGRFQNALGTFQEAPERETMIFHWFWEVLGGGGHAPAIPGGGLSDPLNQDFSRQTKHHWNWARARAMGLGKDRHKGLGEGVWCLTFIHAVAQSAVADIISFRKNVVF